MTPIVDLVGKLVGFALPLGVMAGWVYLTFRYRRSSCSDVAKELALAMNWPFDTLDPEERAAVLAIESMDRFSPAATWEAPDATFAALTVTSGQRESGVVVATPLGRRRQRCEISELLKREMPRSRPTLLTLPGDLSSRTQSVAAYLYEGRVIVRGADVKDKEALERLVMCACAVVDAIEADRAAFTARAPAL